MQNFDGNSNCNNNLIIIIKIIIIMIIVTKVKTIRMIRIEIITFETIYNYCFYIHVFLDASQIWDQVKILIPQERDKIIATAAAAGQQATAWLKEMENAIKVN